MSEKELFAIVDEELDKHANEPCSQRICARVIHAIAEAQFRQLLSDRGWEMFTLGLKVETNVAVLKAKLGSMAQIGLNDEDAEFMFSLYDSALRICEYMLDEFSQSRYQTAEAEQDTLVSISADLSIAQEQMQERQAKAVMCFLSSGFIRSMEMLLEYLRVFLLGEADHARLMAECKHTMDIMLTHPRCKDHLDAPATQQERRKE